MRKRQHENLVRKHFHIPVGTPLTEYRYSLTEDHRAIELCFPGATVAWDIWPGRRPEWSEHYARLGSTGSEMRLEEGQSCRLSIVQTRNGMMVIGAVKFIPKGFIFGNGRVNEQTHVSKTWNVQAHYVVSEERWVVIR